MYTKTIQEVAEIIIQKCYYPFSQSAQAWKFKPIKRTANGF